MAEKIIKGSCLCGAVNYQIRAPFLFYKYCHCSRCRKTSGTAYGANILLVAEQFEWTKGMEFIKRFELASAKHFCSGFCSNCGSTMPWQTKNEKYYLVPTGTLDDDPGCRPQNNVFWGSRAPWHCDVADLPKCDEEG